MGVEVMPPRSFRSAIVAVVLFGIFVTWSMATARYGGPDEPAHVLRAASVASGDFVGDRAVGLAAGYRIVTVPAALTTGDPTCFRHDDDRPATCAVARPGATGTATAASSAGTYPPLYYALVGVPVRLFGDTSSVLWYRLVAAAWCAFVVGLAVSRSRRFVAVPLVIVITPAAWFLFGVVNPNALEIALALLAWVGVERIRVHEKSNSLSDALWVSIPMALAILIRPIAVLAWLAMVGVLVVVRRGRPNSRSLAKWLALFGPAVVAGCAAIGWNAWAAVAVNDSRTAESLSLTRRVWRSIDGLVDTWREMVGSLGWLEFSIPWISAIFSWSVVAVAIWLVCRAARPLRVAWAWTLVVLVCGPIVFETALADRVGFIWQGRYSIATAIGLLIVGIGEWNARLRPSVLRWILYAVAMAQIVTLWAVLQRYTVGAHGSWTFDHARWDPPVPPIFLLGADAVLMVAAIWMSIGRSVSGGAFSDLSPHDVERRTSTEPLDLLGTERVDGLEVDR